MEFSISPYTRKLNACRRGPAQYNMKQIDEISKFPESKVEALPNELWLKICEYTDFQTSKELRLVNRNLSVFACKKLFAEVYATALPEKLENLRKIANSPNVAPHVKKITYVIDRLDSRVLKFQNWKELAAHVSTGPVSDETRAKYNRHRELYREQRALVQGKAEASILAECIPLFTNIQDIEMINWSSIFHNPAFIDGPQPILSYLFQDTLISAVDIFDCGHPVERRVGKPHAAFINAFASAGKSMNTLILDDLPWGFWAKAGYTPLFLQVESSIAVAFANLKLLRLTTCLGTMGSAKNPKSPMCRFIAFLSATPNLQHLDLTLRPLNTLGEEFFNEDDIDLTAMFKKLTWPKLSTFDIDNCKVERDAFIKFMERHKETMRHVIISCVELLEPDLHIFNSEEQQEIDDRDASLVGTRPGESWAFTAKHLAPILNLCHAEFSYLDDAYITRRSGAQYAGQGGMRPEEYPRKQAYCHELTEYLIFGGEDDDYDLPVYGNPVLRCPCCACRIEETETSEEDEESQTDEDGEENDRKDSEDSAEESWEDSEDSDK